MPSMYLPGLCYAVPSLIDHHAWEVEKTEIQSDSSLVDTDASDKGRLVLVQRREP